MLCDHPPACPPSCGHCLAFDNITRALCTLAPASTGSKWCAVHEELQVRLPSRHFGATLLIRVEQAKLLKSYKRMTLAVDSFDAASLPPSFEGVEAEAELGTLEKWSEASRSKWSLTLRVVVARDEHHRQFYVSQLSRWRSGKLTRFGGVQQGGDWGHCLFVSTLSVEDIGS